MTAGTKQIYRTDASGTGDYRLVGTLTDGSQSSYLDTTADAGRSETRQTEPFNKDAIIPRPQLQSQPEQRVRESSTARSDLTLPTYLSTASTQPTTD